jgi:hypothetical protein
MTEATKNKLQNRIELTRLLAPLLDAIYEKPLATVEPGKPNYEKIPDAKELIDQMTPEVLESFSPEMAELFSRYKAENRVDYNNDHQSQGQGKVHLHRPENPAQIRGAAHEFGHAMDEEFLEQQTKNTPPQDKKEAMDYNRKNLLTELTAITAEVLCTDELEKRGYAARETADRFSDVNEYARESRAATCVIKMTEALGLSFEADQQTPVLGLFENYKKLPNADPAVVRNFQEVLADENAREINEETDLGRLVPTHEGKYAVGTMLGIILAKKVSDKEISLQDVSHQVRGNQLKSAEALGNLGLSKITPEMIQHVENFATQKCGIVNGKDAEKARHAGVEIAVDKTDKIEDVIDKLGAEKKDGNCAFAWVDGIKLDNMTVASGTQMLENFNTTKNILEANKTKPTAGAQIQS